MILAALHETISYIILLWAYIMQIIQWFDIILIKQQTFPDWGYVSQGTSV